MQRLATDAVRNRTALPRPRAAASLPSTGRPAPAIDCRRPLGAALLPRATAAMHLSAAPAPLSLPCAAERPSPPSHTTCSASRVAPPPVTTPTYQLLCFSGTRRMRSAVHTLLPTGRPAGRTNHASLSPRWTCLCLAATDAPQLLRCGKAAAAPHTMPRVRRAASASPPFPPRGRPWQLVLQPRRLVTEMVVGRKL